MTVKTPTLSSNPNPQLQGFVLLQTAHAGPCPSRPCPCPCPCSKSTPTSASSSPHPLPHCHIRQHTHRSGHLKLSGPTQLLSCRGYPDLGSKPNRWHTCAWYCVMYVDLSTRCIGLLLVYSLPSQLCAMSPFSSQQIPCRRIRLVRPLYPDRTGPRQAGPTSPSPSPAPPQPPHIDRWTGGQMVRASWHTAGLWWSGLSGCLVLSGAVRCTDLGAFLLRAPPFTSSLPTQNPPGSPFHFRTPSLNSSPVSSGPGRNRPQVEALRRKGRRRVHDVSFCGDL